MGQERKHSHRRLSSAKPHTATVQLSAANQPDPRKSSGGRGTVFRQDTRTLEIVRSLKGYSQKRRAIARNTGPTTGKVSIRWRQTKVRDCKIELRSISKWRLRSRR